MTRISLTAAAASAFLLFVGLAPAPASAAPTQPGLTQSVLDSQSQVEKTQYWGPGRCWRRWGWHGPGWYRCGYGWGGGRPWGWHRGGGWGHRHW
jgi:hypothetical protein